LPGASFLHWFNLGAACYWAPDMRPRAKEAYEAAVKLGQPASTSGRVDSSRLAQLASSHAILALLTVDPEREAHRTRAFKLLALIDPPPTDASVLATIGTTYEELGDRAKALDWLAQAIKAGYSIKKIERSPWLKELRSDERYPRLRQ